MNRCTEQDLRRALAPVRPDPDGFRRAVERKLAEREEAPRPEASASAWRRAASALPLDLLDPGGSSGGALAALLGKQLGAGKLLGALALPVVSLAMLALVFLAGLRAVLRVPVGTGPAGERTADELVRSWWRANAWRAAAALGLLALLGWTQPAEAVVLCLLLSMGVVAALLTRLRRAGLASRASAGAFTASFLGALLGLGLCLGEVGVHVSSARVPGFWAPTLVFWGCLVCDVLGRWRRGWSPWRKLAGAVLPTALVALWLAALGGRPQPPGPEPMARFVERHARGLDDAVEWRRAGRVGAWLRAQGVALDLARPRGALAAAWAGRPAGELFDASFSPQALAGAARLGVVPDELWRAVADEPGTLVLLHPGGAPLRPGYAELRLAALVRAGTTGAQRDDLARRLWAGWPAPAAPRALEDMAGALELAELLERPLFDHRPQEDVRADARRALELHWAGAGRGEPAPFTSAPAAPGEALAADLMHLEATWAALELGARFGFPEAVDLDALRRFLLRAATPSLVEALAPASWTQITTQPYRHDAAALLRALEALPQAAALLAPGPAGWRAERVLAATALLVLLCILATLGAGSGHPARVIGSRSP